MGSTGFAVDLHTHTRFFHGLDGLGRRFDPLGFRMLATVARRRGLDGLATTNHDYARRFDDEVLAVIPGIEVTTTAGHVLVVGPDPPTETEPGELTPRETCELAHDRGCVAIIAHPFRNSTVREADADFDAIELNGKGTESHEWIRDIAAERGLPLVGGSDAHYPMEVARAFTRVHADELTPEGVVEAVRDGAVEARIDERPVQRVLRSAYRVVHGRKGWLDRPRPEPPGLGTPPGEHGNEPDGNP